MYGPLWKDLTHSSIASMFDFEQVNTGSWVINFDIMIAETTSYNDSSDYLYCRLSVVEIHHTHVSIKEWENC